MHRLRRHHLLPARAGHLHLHLVAPAQRPALGRGRGHVQPHALEESLEGPGPLGGLQPGQGRPLPQRGRHGLCLRALRGRRPQVHRRPHGTAGGAGRDGQPAAALQLPGLQGDPREGRAGHDHGRHDPHRGRPERGRHEARGPDRAGREPARGRRARGGAHHGEEDRDDCPPEDRGQGARRAHRAGAQDALHGAGRGHRAAGADLRHEGRRGRLREVPRDHARALEDLLPGLPAAGPRGAAGRLGHLQLVPLHRRAHRRPRRREHDDGGPRGLGGEAQQDLRPAGLPAGLHELGGLGPGRQRSQVLADREAVPGHGRRHGHGPREG
mmetsp:Transcript_39878/g.113900  ORF Transcript_39878/g.113900 Transcript_39878/m.113900 type:complete len:326 (+) Transcript_39878:1552-2529(+)